ncbi:unnamed protein product [Spodoptera exigua]|nr:unnamed protein product [Spodoptera exigua]
MVLSCYVEIQQKATHERCTDVTGPSRPHSVMSSSMSRAASEAPGRRQNAGHYTTLHYTHHASSTIQLRKLHGRANSACTLRDGGVTTTSVPGESAGHDLIDKG